jgi:hypothetical protein
VMDEWERKAQARARRARRLAAEREGMDLRSRRVPSGNDYVRGLKYRPRDVDDWDLLD